MPDKISHVFTFKFKKMLVTIKSGTKVPWRTLEKGQTLDAEDEIEYSQVVSGNSIREGSSKAKTRRNKQKLCSTICKNRGAQSGGKRGPPILTRRRREGDRKVLNLQFAPKRTSPQSE